VQAGVSPVQRGRFQLPKAICIMSTHSPALIKRMTDVLDEIIPAMAVDERTPALIAHIAGCVLKAVEERAGYMTLLAVASAESDAIRKEPVGAATLPGSILQCAGDDHGPKRARVPCSIVRGDYQLSRKDPFAGNCIIARGAGT
jgi:hypothetical protein